MAENLASGNSINFQFDADDYITITGNAQVIASGPTASVNTTTTGGTFGPYPGGAAVRIIATGALTYTVTRPTKLGQFFETAMDPATGAQSASTNSLQVLANSGVVVNMMSIPGYDPTGVLPSDAALDLAYASGAREIIVVGRPLFQLAHVFRRAVVIAADGLGSYAKFVPLISNTTFLTFDGRGLSYSGGEVTDELQLAGPGLRDIRIVSDRSIRANGVQFIRCDNYLLRRVNIQGFKGFARKFQKCREGVCDGVITRWNAFTNTADISLSVADTIVASSTVEAGAGDNSNFKYWSNDQIIYPMGPGLVVDNVQRLNVTNMMLHIIPEGHANVEASFVRMFPDYAGVPAATGFDSGGAGLNELAAMYASAGAAGSVSGKLWGLPMRGTTPAVVSNGSTLKLGTLDSVGSIVSRHWMVDGGSSLSIDGGSIGSVRSSARFFTTFTTSGDTLTLVTTNISTGTPVTIDGDITSYFYVRGSGLTGKLALNRADALAVPPVTIASPPASGTITEFAGALFTVLGASTLAVTDKTVKLDQGLTASCKDASSKIFGNPDTGGVWGSGPVWQASHGETLIAEGRNIPVGAVADVALQKIWGGFRYRPTRVEVIGRSGSAAGGSAGIYSAVTGGGTAVMTATSIAAATAANVPAVITSGLTPNYTSSGGGAPAFPLYFRPTVASTDTAARVDVKVFGVPHDA